MKQGLLLRGLIRDTRHWGCFRHKLQRATPYIQWHSVDLPGNGIRHQQSSPTRLSDYRQWLQDYLRQQNIAPPYTIVAMSMGAMLTLDWLQQDSQAISHATLINTSVKSFSSFYQRLSPRFYPGLLRCLFDPDLAQRERFIWRATTQLTTDSIIPTWVEWAKASPVSVRNFLNQLQAAANFQLNPDFQPTIPLQLINAAQDRLVSPHCSEQLAQHWQLPLITHPEAGHDIPLDAPDWLIQHIVSFYEGSPDSTAKQDCSSSLSR